MDNHLSTHGKRLTAAEQIKLIGFKTIKEKQTNADDHQRLSGGITQTVSQMAKLSLGSRYEKDEWSIYFDYADFTKFKSDFPEFLEWLDNPE